MPLITTPGVAKVVGACDFGPGVFLSATGGPYAVTARPSTAKPRLPYGAAATPVAPQMFSAKNANPIGGEVITFNVPFGVALDDVVNGSYPIPPQGAITATFDGAAFSSTAGGGATSAAITASGGGGGSGGSGTATVTYDDEFPVGNGGPYNLSYLPDGREFIVFFDGVKQPPGSATYNGQQLSLKAGTNTAYFQTIGIVYSH